MCSAFLAWPCLRSFSICQGIVEATFPTYSVTFYLKEFTCYAYYNYLAFISWTWYHATSIIISSLQPYFAAFEGLDPGSVFGGLWSWSSMPDWTLKSCTELWSQDVVSDKRDKASFPLKASLNLLWRLGAFGRVAIEDGVRKPPDENSFYWKDPFMNCWALIFVEQESRSKSKKQAYCWK